MSERTGEKLGRCNNGDDPLLNACWEALEAWEDIEPDPLFKARVWEKIRQAPEREPWWKVAVAWLLSERRVAMVTGFVCVMALLWWLPGMYRSPDTGSSAGGTVAVEHTIPDLSQGTSKEAAEEVVASLPEIGSGEALDIFPSLEEIGADLNEHREDELVPSVALGYFNAGLADETQDVWTDSL